jgi:prepilin-type N-terminal cleavage/methylation domain-containing protein
MNIIEQRKRMRGQGGFTLVELLVVVAILAILAGVAVFAVGQLTDDAQDAACEIELRTMKTAAAAYKADTGNNATSRTDLFNGGFLDADTSEGTYSFSNGVPTQTACP